MMLPHLTTSFIDRFWKKAEKTESCWLWKNANGRYGLVSYQKKQYYTHRIAYYIHYGIDPGALLVCHTCDMPSCINPDHLFLGTPTDNARDMVNKGRNGQARWPEHLARGERNGKHTKPESTPRGITHGMVRLGERDIYEIRQLRQQGLPFSAIGERYHISRQQAWRIFHGLSWRHMV